MDDQEKRDYSGEIFANDASSAEPALPAASAQAGREAAAEQVEEERGTMTRTGKGESYLQPEADGSETYGEPASAPAEARSTPPSVYAPFSIYGSEDEKQWVPFQTEATAFDPPQKQRQKKARKPFPWQKFWKTAAISAFALMLVFSTVTSAYLLKDNLSAKDAAANVTQASSASSSSGDVTQTSNSTSEKTISQINQEVSPSVVLITGTNMSGTGEGTGMIVSDDGYIVTNAHVVEDFSNITVTLNNDEKTKYNATIVGYDDTTDIAVLKIDATGLTPVTFGASANLQVGESVVVIGNPLGEEFTGSVTTGIISALNREVEMDDGQAYTYIQTDAAINSGNSGGPLVNMSGQVIGINSAKIDSSVAEGMGFAIPIDTAIPVINDLIEYGYVTGRPYIGISGQSVSDEYSQFYNLPTGVLISSIASGSPAAGSELQVDDIITKVNGTAVSSIGELNNIKNQSSPGDTIELTVYRYSTQKTFTVKIKMTEMTPDTTQ